MRVRERVFGAGGDGRPIQRPRLFSDITLNKRVLLSVTVLLYGNLFAFLLNCCQLSDNVLSSARNYSNGIEPGSLYLAGLAQAIAPHAGFLIPSDSGRSGAFIHIRVEDGQWTLN